MKITFIVPAYNEEKNIGETLASIKNYTPDVLNYEIIVVDNGSTDRTVDISKSYGCKVLICPDCTVAGLRNNGVRAATGDVYVFLDADVRLTKKWQDNIVATINSFKQNDKVITGSRCGISSKRSWIERSWFQPLLYKDKYYINSGHLITTKKMFEEVNGFDDTLKTGEDPDFSRRAIMKGANIVHNSKLEVVHEGYPKTLKEFIKREIWHGSGTFNNIKTILKSKPALLSIIFLILHFGAFFSLVPFQNTKLALVFIMIIMAECLAASIAQYKHQPRYILTNTFVYYFYFLGRSLYLITSLAGGIKGYRHR